MCKKDCEEEAGAGQKQEQRLTGKHKLAVSLSASQMQDPSVYISGCLVCMKGSAVIRVQEKTLSGMFGK